MNKQCEEYVRDRTAKEIFYELDQCRFGHEENPSRVVIHKKSYNDLKKRFHIEVKQ